MSFDYKQIPRRPDSSGSFLIGLFFGFLLGLGVAAGIAIYFFKTPIPFTDKGRVPDKAPPADQKLPEAPKAAKAEDKPRFDFYRILPGKEEPVTERQMREAAKQAGKPGAPKDRYFLQAGSFQNPADADNLKARLALMGLEEIAVLGCARLTDRKSTRLNSSPPIISYAAFSFTTNQP